MIIAVMSRTAKMIPATAAARRLRQNAAVTTGPVPDGMTLRAAHWTAEVRRMTLSSQRWVMGRLLHSCRVSSFATARYPSSTSRIAATNDAAGAHHRHLEVQVERADVHVRRPDHRRVVIDGEVLRVQHRRIRVLEDPHPRLQQEPVVGVLRMRHHELLTPLTDEQLDRHPPLRRGGDRVQQRVIRHEVGAGDRQPVLRPVDQRVEQPQVVLIREPRTARHDLTGQVTVVGAERAPAGPSRRAAPWSR